MTTQTAQLQTTNLTARPAGLGDQCEEYMRRPLILKDDLLPEDGPLLVRCKDQANNRLILKNGDDVYTVKFCKAHYERLQCQIEEGISLVEILEDQEMEAHR